MMSRLQGDDDMAMVAYANDTNLYVRESLLVEPIIAPSVEADDLMILVGTGSVMRSERAHIYTIPWT